VAVEAAAAVVVVVAVAVEVTMEVVSLGMIICLQMVRFSYLLKRHETYGRTDPLIKMRGRI